jgi:hypothetical protein
MIWDTWCGAFDRLRLSGRGITDMQFRPGFVPIVLATFRPSD